MGLILSSSIHSDQQPLSVADDLKDNRYKDRKLCIYIKENNMKQDKLLIIGGHEFDSRFILGSGKYSLDLINAAVQNGSTDHYIST